MSYGAAAESLRILDELIGEVEGDDPKVRKRVRILDAAATLFVAQGYRKTSMEEVAKEAGVAKGTLYLYFERKIDLLIAATSREKRSYLAHFAEVFDESLPAADRLRSWCIAVLLSSVEMPIVGRLVASDDLNAVMAEMPPALIAAGERNTDQILLPLIEEMVGPHTWTESELRDRVNVLLGLGFLAASLNNDHVLRGMTPRRYAEVLADIIVVGLSRRERVQ